MGSGGEGAEVCINNIYMIKRLQASRSIYRLKAKHDVEIAETAASTLLRLSLYLLKQMANLAVV